MKSGSWSKVLDAELEDSQQREDSDPARMEVLNLEDEVTAQFIKFEIVSWRGKSGGLQFFDIYRY